MAEAQTVSEFAERVLFSNSLEEKLTHAPPALILDPPRKGTFRTPSLPGRPEELRPRANSGKSPFPSEQQIHNEEQRGILLHFFTNHELLAVELMALALLKFPDAPDSFRKGVLRTLQEEQNHTRWYLERMKSCGLRFGDHHLSPMIWSHISSMESPLDYVSRLSLTFEQANLDYAKYYSEILKKAGDHESSQLLAQIYKDEIAHVGHGLKWLRRWKENAQSDWDAWNQQLHFPLSPIRAKGQAPFNEEGRRKAGLDSHFINSLKHFQSSRGRSPDLYWFNPEVEISCTSSNYQAPKQLEALAADLEYAFALAAPSADDLLLLRKLPSDKHREALAQYRLTFPEVAPLSDLSRIRQTRNIREERPWGIPNPTLLSKELALVLRQEIDPQPIPSAICQSAEEIHHFIEAHPVDDWVAKPLHSAAGRGLRRFSKTALESLPKFSVKHLIEPWLEKTLEFSLLYHSHPAGQGGLNFLGISYQEVSERGQWISSTSTRKPASILPPEQARLLATKILPAAKNEIHKALGRLLKKHQYHGPLCIDSFLYQDEGHLSWQRVSEINVRWSMGRLAHQLRLKLSPDRSLTLTTALKKELATMGALENTILLGDPTTAHQRVPIVNFLPSHKTRPLFMA